MPGKLSTKWWRWAFIAAVPLLLHAVLMSYSRGAMLSLVVGVPLLILRSRRKRQFAFVFVLLIARSPTWRVGSNGKIPLRLRDMNRRLGERPLRLLGCGVRDRRRLSGIGVGMRNSNLFTYQYGADVQGRTIHSQYLQTMADSGYPALFFYLVAFGVHLIAMAAHARRT